ncbi:lipid asymmetry maintenance protein MlaB [Polaromonas sp. UC242_47]|uniref:lipid asymmetry maintenance protein MlaB n=1 Tax=Polaromonas sp. UC242_47 TaxID=3374626 RepID=UPI0037A85FD9
MRLPAQLTHDLAVPALLALKQALAAQTGVAVVADASALRIFDSSALAVLLDCRREVLAAGKTFSVQGLPERLRQLAGLYGVETLLPATA